MAATLIGFLLTSCSILVALNQTWIIRQAKRTEGYKLLVHYVFAALRWAFATAILTVIGIGFDPAWNGWW